MTHPDPQRRFLPAGFPLPDAETIEGLRRNVREQTKTPYPPETAELVALIVADEAGLDLFGVDPNEVWALPVAERAPLFAAIAHALGDL